MSECGPRIGELFAGYGGLGMGVQAVFGGEVAWVSEYDKGPNKILAHRFPGVPNHGDITKIDWSTVEPVDILTGGSPCQDLSHAGARKGMTEGTRSNLWVAMREAIAQLRPGLVVWENVGGAFSASATSEVEPCAGCVGDGSGVHLRALGRVLGDLASLGFDARWHALRAADVGAPHGRLRVFVVAHPAGDTRWQQHRDGAPAADASDRAGHGEWSRTEPGQGGPPAGERYLRLLESMDPSSRLQVAIDKARLLPTPRTSDTTGAGVHGEGGLDLTTAISLLPTPRAGDGEKGGPNQRGSSGDFMLPTAAASLIPTPSVADATGGHERRGGSRGDELLLKGMAKEGHLEKWGQYAAAIHRWESVTRPAPPPTELGPKGNPRLSAAFSEWMMGVPAGWITDVPGLTRNEALKACGNGVVPQQATAALREMSSWEMAA